MPDSPHVAVVGAGISGLACAYRLKRLNIPFLLLESSAHPGGLLGTVERDGFLFESGPQSFQGTDALLALIHELGIASELLEANPRAPRYVFHQGSLKQVPMSPQALVTTSLLSAGSRWKVATEPFRRTRPPGHEESVADFVRRKFGHEILEYLVSPFVSGVYAGDPEKLSLKAAFPTLEEWESSYGSILRGAMKSRGGQGERKKPPALCSFRRGMATMPRAIGEKLGPCLQPGVAVRSIRKSSDRAGEPLEIHAESLGRSESIRASAVVLSTPAYVSAQLIGSISSPLAATLSGIAYAPVAVVAAAYFKSQIAEILHGFGFLVPRKENLHILGTVWNSSLFPGRAPHDKAVMTTFLGGATDLDIIEKSREVIVALAHKENAHLLEISGEPIASEVWKHEKALPQYNLGHHHAIERLRKGEQENPGIFLGGNYLEGPSIGKCVEQGFKTADAVQLFLSQKAAASL